MIRASSNTEIPAANALLAKVLPDDLELRRHAANAVARHKPRGWRIEAPDRSANVDAIIALTMALDRFENQPEPTRLLGWL